MLRIGSVVMTVSDVDRAAAFWTQALGYAPGARNPAFLAPQSGDAARLHLDTDDTMHLDLWADDEAEQQAEVERLVSLGATRVDWQYPGRRRLRGAGRHRGQPVLRDQHRRLTPRSVIRLAADGSPERSDPRPT
jgi:catechol 2,3-dioxygenase-like lactoylglutathione lyase family enzyme